MRRSEDEVLHRQLEAVRLPRDLDGNRYVQPHLGVARRAGDATEEGYSRCRAAFEKLALAAEKTGAIISIEAYWRNVISLIERAQDFSATCPRRP